MSRTVETVLTTHGVTIAYEHPVPRIPARDVPRGGGPAQDGPAQEWACAGRDPDLFFPTDDAVLARAVAVCAGCALRELCLELALARSESGVWGGVLLQDGAALARVPRRGRPRKNAA